MTRHLVARLDNVGDVLLAGPAVRAVAASGGPVTFVAGPRGAAAAALLPGVDEVVVLDAPWVPFDPAPVDAVALGAFVDAIAGRRVEDAVVLTSFHQSPLPLALLLRQAGVARIAATCVDHPGSLLDVRHPYLAQLHEVKQSLSLCAAAGHRLPDGDDGRLLVDLPPAAVELPAAPYVVVHPGASVPARALPVGAAAATVDELARRGAHVVVTGSDGEAPIVAAVAGPPGRPRVEVRTGGDLAGFAHLLAGAAAVVCGNTGPAHLAASVGAPVVEAFAPVVAPHRWHPWGVPHALLYDARVPCAGCRARECPVPGQPCLEPFSPAAVVEALGRLGTLEALGEVAA